ADSAMYAAKAGGRNSYHFFTPGLDAAMRRRHIIVRDMREALQRGEFSLLYQPQVDMASTRIVSAEALLRWSTRDHAVPPDEFIPVAEESGLMLPLGQWVLREACRQLRAWRDNGYADLRICINLSLCQVLQAGFAAGLIDTLRETGLHPSDLHLEITEGTLMQPGAENLVCLKHLSQSGVRLTVDHFGSGHCNLTGLQRVPLHTLKIDQSFVHGIGSQHEDMAVIDVIIAMARSMRLEVVAEGVETGEQASFLRAHGCTTAQGYYFGKPVSADQFTGYLRRQGAS
ncbi:MAG TPA: EAL domain-containing protein, partial [Rubrivivax sp.]|nr:EAL domain-containing protein [Rubrivivax sp.]